MNAENLKRGQVGRQLLLPSIILLLALAATPSVAQNGATIDVEMKSVFNPFTMTRVDTSSKPVSPKPISMSDGTELPALMVMLAEAQGAGTRASSTVRGFKIRGPVVSQPRFLDPFRISL